MKNQHHRLLEVFCETLFSLLYSYSRKWNWLPADLMLVAGIGNSSKSRFELLISKFLHNVWISVGNAFTMSDCTDYVRCFKLFTS